MGDMIHKQVFKKLLGRSSVDYEQLQPLPAEM